MILRVPRRGVREWGQWWKSKEDRTAGGLECEVSTFNFRDGESRKVSEQNAVERAATLANCGRMDCSRSQLRFETVSSSPPLPQTRERR